MAPEIDVGHYGLNVQRPLSGSLSEETKATLRRESVSETAYSWAETTFLVAAGAVGGVGTGLKAVVNQSAKAVGSLVSLGYWEAGDVIPVNERDLGYDQAALPARIGSESALAAATLGLSVSRVGVAAKVGQGLTILDTAGNLAQGGVGVIDARVNGLTLENSAKIAAGAIGVAEARKIAQSLGNVAEGTAKAAKASKIAPSSELVLNSARREAWRSSFGQPTEGLGQLVRDLPKGHEARQELARMILEIRASGGAVANRGLTGGTYARF